MDINTLASIVLELDDLAILLRGHGVDDIAQMLDDAKKALELKIQESAAAATTSISKTPVAE